MHLHRILRFLPLAVLLALACGDGSRNPKGALGNAGGPGGKAGKKRARPKQATAAPTPPPAEGATAAAAPTPDARSRAPFTEMRGYTVRGTDESSFRRCGSSRTYLTRVAPQAASRFSQHYRWAATSLFDPVYIVVMGRIVDDTVTVGEHTYTAVVEIREVLLERSAETPACPKPPKGSMIGSR